MSARLIRMIQEKRGLETKEDVQKFFLELFADVAFLVLAILIGFMFRVLFQ